MPPKTANGLPGTVSQTSSPPGSTSPWTRAASASASSFEAVPTIRYRQRRSTAKPSCSSRSARSRASPCEAMPTRTSHGA